MPGRSRTGSRPLRTVMSLAVYTPRAAHLAVVVGAGRVRRVRTGRCAGAPRTRRSERGPQFEPNSSPWMTGRRRPGSGVAARAGFRPSRSPVRTGVDASLPVACVARPRRRRTTRASRRRRPAPTSDADARVDDLRLEVPQLGRPRRGVDRDRQHAARSDRTWACSATRRRRCPAHASTSRPSDRGSPRPSSSPTAASASPTGTGSPVSPGTPRARQRGPGRGRGRRGSHGSGPFGFHAAVGHAEPQLGHDPVGTTPAVVSSVWPAGRCSTSAPPGARRAR